MKIFDQKYLSEYLKRRLSFLIDEISKISDEDIINNSMADMKEYYYEKGHLEYLKLLHESRNTLSANLCVIRKDNPDKHLFPNELPFYEIPGYKITQSIYYDGEFGVFNYIPSTSTYDFPVVDMINPNRDDEYGWITYSVEIPQSTLDRQENKSEYIEKLINQKLEHIQTHIDYANQDIDEYNRVLPNYIENNLKNRLKDAEGLNKVKESLQIPLNKKNSAPTIIPIKIKAKGKKNLLLPKKDKTSKEMYLSENDYNEILRIIHTCCSAMEKTPNTFNSIKEEDLRNFIIATLESHYEDQVSGETFRGDGKTDILIQTQNKAAFVGECKIWKGIKSIKTALEQLMGYTLYKDNKNALIFFNKDNKDFSKIIEETNSYLMNNYKSVERVYPNLWTFTAYNSNNKCDMKIAFCIYDLHIKE